MGWLKLLVLLLVGLVATAFCMQNGSRTVELSLDLGVAAWRLAEPLSVPTVIGASLASGFVLGALFLSGRAAAATRRAREAERQAALAGTKPAASDPASWV
jgi:hypothetical protein